MAETVRPTARKPEEKKQTSFTALDYLKSKNGHEAHGVLPMNRKPKKPAPIKE